MVDTARELGFPFMAGSSLPVTWRTPSVEMPRAPRSWKPSASATAASTATIFTASKPSSAWSSGAGGETGVRGCRRIAATSSGKRSREGVLAEAADGFARCAAATRSPRACQASTTCFPTSDSCGPRPRSGAYRYQHADGMKSTML